MPDAVPITDALARLASPEDQRHAADLAREAFTRTFRQAAAESPADQAGDIPARCRSWVASAPAPDAAALRLAMLLAGLDQWGLAFSQAFGITAIPSLTRLIGDLRTQTDAAEDARLQQQMEQLDARESNAIDFKISLRRDIHMALWHAMVGSADPESAQPILRTLGSLLLTLDARMPELGWRLVADTLAHIQIRLLGAELPPLAQSGTQQLLDALRQALPAEHYKTILAHAASAMLDWQRARRPH
ncbi:hypothetical protein [uncultured Castellaniella sp.]|uniref:hypothetical protein n=1 Tax=uncultured Castellaniella sp. TaxID=647907 RepID=UPI00262C3ABE|nr:hypothetical protein [uncultured Castellaniella sp.]